MSYPCCQHCDDGDFHPSVANAHAGPCPDGCNDAPPPAVSVHAQAKEDARQLWRAAFGTDPS
jgi:hypothetical protein